MMITSNTATANLASASSTAAILTSAPAPLDQAAAQAAPVPPVAAQAQPAPAPNASAALPALPPLPLFAHLLGLADAANDSHDDVSVSPTPAKPGQADAAAPADITQASQQGGNDALLAAMSAPIIAPLAPGLTPPPVAASATGAADGTPTAAGVGAAQHSPAQANPALTISLNPAAIALNGIHAAQVPAVNHLLREPLAAAAPGNRDSDSDADAGQHGATPAPGSAPGSASEGRFSLPALPAASSAAAPAPAPILAAAQPAAATPRDGDAAAPSPALASSGAPPAWAGLSGLNGAAAPAGADSIKLNGQPGQWQAPLRDALGDRLQVQLGRQGENAVIRLDPPMLGRIEISIRHLDGALQVNLSASNGEVLRQLQNIGDNLRSDLVQRQYVDVSVNISATPRSPAAQAFADGDARGQQRQGGRERDDDEPGRALSDNGQPAPGFAMNQQRET